VDSDWRCAGVDEIPCKQEGGLLGSRSWQSSSDLRGREWEFREREREGRMGMGEAGRARSVPGEHLI
jgi:hypothetical protein